MTPTSENNQSIDLENQKDTSIEETSTTELYRSWKEFEEEIQDFLAESVSSYKEIDGHSQDRQLEKKMANFLTAIQIYDPEKDDLKNWLEEYVTLTDLAGLSVDQAKKFLLVKLDNRTKLYYKMLDLEKFDELKDLTKELLAGAGFEDSKTIAIKKIMDFKLDNNQKKIYENCLKFKELHLAAGVHLSDEELWTKLLTSGIKDRDIINWMLNNPQHKNSYNEMAKNLTEHLMLKDMMKIKLSPDNKVEKVWKKNQNNFKNVQNKVSQPNQISEKECYNCHQKGHIRPQCPQLKEKDSDIQIIRSNRIQDVKNEQYQSMVDELTQMKTKYTDLLNERTSDVSLEQRRINLTNNDKVIADTSNLITRVAKRNGLDIVIPVMVTRGKHKEHCEALVDTGAHSSMMCSDIGELLGFNPNKSQFKCSSEALNADGTKIHLLGEMNVIVWPNDNLNVKTRMLIKPTPKSNIKKNPYKIILGVDFLEASGINIDFLTCKVFTLNGLIDSTWKTKEESKILNSNTIHIHRVENNFERSADLKRLLEEVPEAFGENGKKIGCYTGEIPDVTVGNVFDLPPERKAYKMTEEKKKIIREQICVWKENDVLIEGCAKVNIPMLVVPKRVVELNIYKNENNVTVAEKEIKKNWRLVLDARRINQIIRPMDGSKTRPWSERMLKMYGMNLFTVLDFSSYYLQIPQAKSLVGLIGVEFENKNYIFQRTAFGIKSSPQIAQYVTNQLCNEFNDKMYTLLNCDNVLVEGYQDDVTISTKNLTKDQHIELVIKFIKFVNSKGLLFNVNKIQLAYTKIDYLSFNIGEGGYEPSEAYCESLKRLPSPISPRAVKRCLGMLNYFRFHVKDYAKEEKIINQSIKDKPFKWLECHELALRKLINGVVNKAKLYIPDFNKPFILLCDSTKESCGAMLGQIEINSVNEEPRLVPISFMSKMFKNKRPMVAIAAELKGLVTSLKMYKHLVYDNSTLVMIDHKPLIGLIKNCSQNSDRFVNEVMEIATYCHLKFFYLRGEKNKIADCLSRCNIRRIDETSISLINEEPISQFLWTDGLGQKLEKKEIETIIHLEKIFETNLAVKVISDNKVTTKPIPEKNIMRVTYGQEDPENLPIVQLTKERKWELMKEAHEATGHASYKGMFHHLKQRAYWLNIKADVVKFLKLCELCNRRNSPKSYQGFMKNFDAEWPLQVIQIDLLGPFKRCVVNNEYQHIVLITDLMSRYTWGKCISNADSENVFNVMKEMLFEGVGIPSQIISDSATYFLKVKTMVESMYASKWLFGTKGNHHYTAVVDRKCRTLNQKIALLAQENVLEWSLIVQKAIYIMNNTWHEGLETTPHQVLFGWQPLTKSDLESEDRNWKILINFEEGLVRENSLKLAVETLKSMRIKELSKINAKVKVCKRAQNLKVGSLVFIRKTHKLNEIKKFASCWHPNYQIKRIVGSTYYVSKVNARGRPLRVTLNNIKLDWKSKSKEK